LSYLWFSHMLSPIIAEFLFESFLPVFHGLSSHPFDKGVKEFRQRISSGDEVIFHDRAVEPFRIL